MEDEKKVYPSVPIYNKEVQALTSSEILITALGLLAAERGIKESDEMKAAREEAIGATADQSAFSAAILKYQDLCREGIDSSNSELVTQSVVAEMLLSASIRIAAGRIEPQENSDGAIITLEDAVSYAYGTRDYSLVDDLEEIIAQLKGLK